MITIDEIFEYVMHNPENTNPNILKQMLIELADSLSQANEISDSNDPGFSGK